MSVRTKSLLIGMLIGAATGALFGWISSHESEDADRSTSLGLATLQPGDLLKIGISLLTLGREMSQMVKRA
jgi:gas vesicle protein